MTKEELKRSRETLGLTQEEMAKELNDTPVSTYRKWEQGKRRVPGLVDAHFKRSKTDLKAFSLEEAKTLAERAEKEGVSVDELVAKAVKEYLAKVVPLFICAFFLYTTFASRSGLGEAGMLEGLKGLFSAVTNLVTSVL